MNIQISSDNIEVSESMKSLVNSKLQKLERFWSDIPEDSIYVRVVLNSGPEDTFLVRLDVDLNGETYYTDEVGYALETALIDAVEELSRQYKKKKEKAGNWEVKREDKFLSEDDLEVEKDDEEEHFDYNELDLDDLEDDDDDDDDDLEDF